ncbi:hypothetical protein K1719_003157 [Acacia pycnantha]|nr:hypothetical protein K1719_003157 [Acacia pycnantha]
MKRLKISVLSSVSSGKSRKETNIWKKRSVFFDLPYWRNLDVRHCIDVMHVEKNVCDSIVGTLLNIQGSSNDGVKARLDLQAMGIREDLHPRPYGKRTYCPRLLILCLRMRNEALGRRGASVKSVDPDELSQVHLYILNNVDEVQASISAHKEAVRKENHRMTEQRLIREHNRTFAKWFKQKVEGSECVSDTMKWLARGPEVEVISWNSYVINGYTFYTKSLDDRSTRKEGH